MPTYIYEALSESGGRVTGEGVAASEQELGKELADKDLLVQKIRRKRALVSFFGRQGTRPEEFLLFNQEFMALLRAGLTIPEALELVANRPENPRLARILRRVLEEVRHGSQLSEACRRHADVFDGLYVSAVKTGEKTGDLAGVLARYQEYLKHKVALQKKVSHALAYPLFLLVTLVIILGVLFAFVMPRFVAMYADFDTELPLPTRVLMGLVENLPLYGPVVVVFAVLGWVAFRVWKATDAGRLQLDTLKERLPYLGTINRAFAVAQLARTLSTLLAGGTPLVEAMSAAQESLANRAYGRRLAQATQEVTEGRSLAQAARDGDIMPDTAVKLIEVGEASGGLDTMLAEVAWFYEGSLENKLARMMALIEPVLMLLMGILVGGTIIVMYLPIFHMSAVIR